MDYFVDAKTKQQHAKVLLYGSYGTGKTWQALHFPAPVMIDMEKGSEAYSEAFDFKVFHTTEPDKVVEGIEYLRKNPGHGRKTIILDSMTEYWSALCLQWQEIFLRRNKRGVGNKEEFYDLQPRDWGQIKGSFKDFLRSLLALDMHVICTCRVKDVYSNSEEKLLKKIGETFDSDRSLPYLFDTVVRLDKDENGKHFATVEKDRTRLLPARFDTHYSIFAYAFRLDGWEQTPLLTTGMPESLRNLALTGEMLGTDQTPPVTGKDGNTKYSGRQMLHIWAGAGNAGQITQLYAKRLLDRYPSEAKATIPQIPKAEPAKADEKSLQLAENFARKLKAEEPAKAEAPAPAPQQPAPKEPRPAGTVRNGGVKQQETGIVCSEIASATDKAGALVYSFAIQPEGADKPVYVATHAAIPGLAKGIQITAKGRRFEKGKKVWIDAETVTVDTETPPANVTVGMTA